MIPKHDANGLLPAGIHEATLGEFEARFAYTIWRKVLFGKLKELIKDLKKIGVVAIYIDGSFITTKRVPNDYDVCWEDAGVDYSIAKNILPILFDLSFPRKNQQYQYSADIFPAHLIESSSGIYFIDFFQRDKVTNRKKGIVKINI